MRARGVAASLSLYQVRDGETGVGKEDTGRDHCRFCWNCMLSVYLRSTQCYKSARAAACDYLVERAREPGRWQFAFRRDGSNRAAIRSRAQRW